MEEAGPSGASAAQSDQALVASGSAEASGIVPQLQNIVATVNLGVKLDLKGVALQARNAEYNPKVRCLLYGSQRNFTPSGRLQALTSGTLPAQLRLPLVCLQRFSAVIMRIRDPKTTALIFASGKVVSSNVHLAHSPTELLLLPCTLA